MKKNDLILLIAVILYSWFFYNQAPGINYLLFSVVLVVSLLAANFSLLRDKLWYIAASGTLISGLCVMLYGTTLAVTANIVSLGLMSAYSVSRGSSVFFAGIYSLYSVITSSGFMIVDLIERQSKKAGRQKTGKIWLKISIGVAILAVFLVFFFLYQDSNPLFRDLTKKIRLDFITWRWVRFTLLGFVLLYGFFYHRNFPGLHRWDTTRKNLLSADDFMSGENRFFGMRLNLNLELWSGIILLALLNVLLLVVNGLDVAYLWATQSLPAGMTYAEYLHQGTATLVISIILAIVILLFYFRGMINFTQKNKSIRNLALIWMIQNIFMVVSTAYRNLLYIEEYSLTYKRIGVYLWLILTIAGLATTMIKIAGKKSNWHLLRVNGWAVYLVLIAFACINWDLLITRFNIDRAERKGVTADRMYLAGLNSPANLPDLMKLPMQETDFEMKEDEYREDDFWYGEDYGDRYNETYNRSDKDQNFTETVHRRLYKFMTRYHETGWLSWTLGLDKAYHRLLQMNREGQIPRLLLRNNNLESLSAISLLNNISYLDVSFNNIRDMAELAYFPKLETLYIPGNNIYNIEKMPELPELKTADFSRNNISDFGRLSAMKKLSSLNISNNNEKVVLAPVAKLSALEKLNISGNSIADYESLANMKSLRSLGLANMKNFEFFKLPALPELKEIDISGNSLNYADPKLLAHFMEFKGLESINLSRNSLSEINLLTTRYSSIMDYMSYDLQEREIKPLFTQLKSLNISDNLISDFSPLSYYTNIEWLDVSGNKTGGSPNSLAGLTRLRYLDLGYTDITSADTLKNLTELVELHLSGNSINDITVLKNFKKLVILKLNSNRIEDISALSSLISLRNLDLSGNMIRDISPLTTLSNLEVLDLRNNQIENVSVLYQMKWLKELHISYLTKKELKKLREELPLTRVYSYSSSSYSIF